MTDTEKILVLRAMMDGDTSAISDATLLVFLQQAAQKILNRMSPYAGNYAMTVTRVVTDPDTGEPVTAPVIDPETGEQMVDPETGEPMTREVTEEVTVNTPYPLTVPERYEMTQIRIALYLYLKRGAEGEIQHIEGGTHRNYGDADIPDVMLKDVMPYVGLIR